MRRLGLFVLLCLAAAGCSSGPAAEPGTLAALSSSPTAAASGPAAAPSRSPGGGASPTPSPTSAPALPAAATAFTREGAEAFGAYWFTVLNAVHASGDPTLIRSISSPKCVTCQRYVDSLNTAATKRQTFQGARWTVNSSTSAVLEPTGTGVLVNFDISAIRVVEETGVVAREIGAMSNLTNGLELSWDGDSWLLLEVIRT